MKNKKTIAKTKKTSTKEVSTKINLSEIKEKLLKMKESIEKTLKDQKKYDLVENEVGDQIDEASQSFDKEIIFEISDKELKNLGEIEAALIKIKKGTYGKCEQCGQEIEPKRLKAIPHSRYCLKCQSKNDKYL